MRRLRRAEIPRIEVLNKDPIRTSEHIREMGVINTRCLQLVALQEYQFIWRMEEDPVIRHHDADPRNVTGGKRRGHHAPLITRVLRGGPRDTGCC